jgi:hypothetical protein
MEVDRQRDSQQLRARGTARRFQPVDTRPIPVERGALNGVNYLIALGTWAVIIVVGIVVWALS